jgi:hypothetical protein
MKRIIPIKSIKSHWRLIIVSVVGVVAVASLLLSRLGSLTNSLSDVELKQQLFSSSWHHIVHDPLNLPFTGLQWLFLTIFNHHGSTVTRLASLCFGVLTLAAFSYVIRRWYGLRAAVFGAIVFACSSWFLHVSRFGTPDVLYLWAVPTLLAAQLIWERHGKHTWVGWLAVVVIGLLLYIPGMVWLIILSFGLQSDQLVRTWRHTRKWWQWLILAVLILALLAPLIVAFIHTPSLVQTWAGLPKHFDDPVNIAKRLVLSISYLAYHGPLNPPLWLDRLPVLDIFGVVMAVMGVIFYAQHLLAPRTRQLAGLWIIGAVFFALAGPVSYSLLVPIAYLLVTGGIGYLLHEWFRVFPRNALARSAAYSLLGLVVAASCVYNLRSYFVAWPHSPAAIATFASPKE